MVQPSRNYLSSRERHDFLKIEIIQPPVRLHKYYKTTVFWKTQSTFLGKAHCLRAIEQVYLCAVQWLKSTRHPSDCLMLILHEGLFNANVYKTNALKWLCHWPMLCVFQHASRSIERSTVSLHYNYNIVNIIMEYIPIKQY